MLLSAVSVLVVALASSEFQEGLMNCPVCIHTRIYVCAYVRYLIHFDSLRFQLQNLKPFICPFFFRDLVLHIILIKDISKKR
jgi:hypothetical protein